MKKITRTDMKTRFMLALMVLPIVAMVGCKKPEVLCDGCSYVPCTGYAPEDATISWTNYNTVGEMNNFFLYVNTARLHYNDTVRVCGYIIGYDDTNYYRNIYENSGTQIDLYITDNPDKRFPGRGWGAEGIMCGEHDKMEWLKDYKAGEKVYVTAFCHPAHPLSECIWLWELSTLSVTTEKPVKL